jgi:hypothetical protein
MLMDKGEFIRPELPPEAQGTHRISHSTLPTDPTRRGTSTTEFCYKRPIGLEEPYM